MCSSSDTIMHILQHLAWSGIEWILFGEYASSNSAGNMRANFKKRRKLHEYAEQERFPRQERQIVVEEYEEDIYYLLVFFLSCYAGNVFRCFLWNDSIRILVIYLWLRKIVLCNLLAYITHTTNYYLAQYIEINPVSDWYVD